MGSKRKVRGKKEEYAGRKRRAGEKEEEKER